MDELLLAPYSHFSFVFLRPGALRPDRTNPEDNEERANRIEKDEAGSRRAVVVVVSEAIQNERVRCLS